MAAVETRCRTIAILAKAPLAGFAKTRLIPALGAEGAANLHQRLLEHLLTKVCSGGLARVVLYTAGEHMLWRQLQQRFGVELRAQTEGDLGDRLQHVCREQFQQAEELVLLGSDCPFIDEAYLKSAFEQLVDHDMVIGPALDGGYVMMGLVRPEPGLFDSMPWGSEQVLSETLKRAKRLGLSCQQLSPLADIDRPEDLKRLTVLPELRLT